MIQAENNNVSLTEFSNFTGLFMEDVNTRYGGRYKQTTNGFPFLLLNYSQTSQYGHFSNTDTSILWTVSSVLTKFLYIFFKKEPLQYGLSLIRTTDTNSWP